MPRAVLPLLILLSACAARARVDPPVARAIATATPTPTPAPTPPSRTPSREILFNEATKPDAPVVRVQADCRVIIGGWRFQEASNVVYSWKTPDGRVSGVAPPPQPHEETQGAWKGDVLHLEGKSHTQRNGAWVDDPVTYDLRKTPAGHLIGTRNASPIDLAPTDIQGPDCSHEPPVP